MPESELHEAQEKFVESKDLAETAMFNLLENDVSKQCTCLSVCLSLCLSICLFNQDKNLINAVQIVLLKDKQYKGRLLLHYFLLLLHSVLVKSISVTVASSSVLVIHTFTITSGLTMSAVMCNFDRQLSCVVIHNCMIHSCATDMLN